MTVSGVVVTIFCGLLTRKRCPSLVTVHMLVTLRPPAGKSVFGNPKNGKVSFRPIEIDVIIPVASR